MKTMNNLKQSWKQIVSFILMPIMIAACLMGAVPAITVHAENEVTNVEDKVLIYASVPDTWENPCLWAWNDNGTNAFSAWPGGKMTADENNKGWYYCYIDKNLSGNIIVNASEGTVQTSDYKTNQQNSWITISEDATAELSNEQMTEGDLPQFVEEASSTEEKIVEEKVTGEMIKIHAKIPSDWLIPCLWAWSAPDGTNVFANWPGQELTLEDDGWYTYEIPDWVNSIIINGNLGEIQTTDVTIEPKELWITIVSSEEFNVVYEKPSEEIVSTEDTTEKINQTTDNATAEKGTEDSKPISTTTIVVIVLIILVVVCGVAFVISKRKK